MSELASASAAATPSAAMIGYAALAVFAGFMAAAAASDVRHLLVRNTLTASCAATGLVFAWLLGGGAGVQAALFAGGAGLVAGFALFSLGVFGGGDGKLIAAAMVWIGPEGGAEFALLTALLGGVLAASMLAALRFPALRGALGPVGRARLSGERPQAPYALAIAPAAVFVFFLHLAALT